MRMGLEKAGWQVSFANDICEHKKAMYETHLSGRYGDFLIGDTAFHVTVAPLQGHYDD